MKVNLGSGTNKIDGFINIDKYAENADLQDDILSLTLKDNSVELVYFSHIIEHFNKDDINLVLNEIKRILQSGGILIIETPDVECLVKKYRRACFLKPVIDKIFYYFENKGIFDKYPLKYIKSAFNTFLLEDTLFIDSFFGGTKPGMEHYYLYNFRLLKKLLEKHGFKNIEKIKSPEYSQHRHSKCNLAIKCKKS